MNRVNLGTADGKPLWLDLDILLRTRLLVQANSGGGKSWLLRRLAEQMFGQVPVIILDPEGEFATLREKFGYVLVGKGGDTPADTRSAALVAHKLLELNASAVCDLYEMKPEARHLWAQLFLDALIDAPKRLWHPLIVILDEAHTFAPEKGAGESAAAGAVIALATRGRKRGFALIPATQRLGKLRKDVAAECSNVLVGRTVLDVDRDRAADALGIGKAGKPALAFSNEIRALKEGGFFALGPALCDTRTLVQVGPVLTSHHEPGSSKHASEAPPMPDKIKHLLPKLADLPKEAEQKAQTEAELRAEIAKLRRDLAAAEKATPAPAEPVKVPVLEGEELTRAEALVEKLTAVAEKLADQSTVTLEALATLKAAIGRAAPALTVPWTSSPKAAARVAHESLRQRTAVSASPATRQTNGHAEPLTGPEQRIVDAIAWLDTLGIGEPEQPAVAFLAGYTYNAGGFNNPKARLRVKGLVEYLPGDHIRLTDEGRTYANAPEQALTTAELHARVLARLDGPMQRILSPLLAHGAPVEMSNEDLAAAANYAVDTGGYNNPRGRLRSLGLIAYPRPGYVVARPILFLGDRE